MSVLVPVMYVREMRMSMGQHGMAMRMRVRFAPIPCEMMLMAMVLIVRVAMRMFQRLMGVVMLVPFANVQPDPDCHQARGHPERPTWHCGPEGQ